MAQFGSKRSGPGQLNSPGDVAVDDDDLVYVSEWENRRVSVFTMETLFVVMVVMLMMMLDLFSELQQV